MNETHPPMTFALCEVDPFGVYEVRMKEGSWAVWRCGKLIGYLPQSMVRADGPFKTAEMLIGYGVFVSRRLFNLGPAEWSHDSFPALVDKEVSKL